MSVYPLIPLPADDCSILPTYISSRLQFKAKERCVGTTRARFNSTSLSIRAVCQNASSLAFISFPIKKPSTCLNSKAAPIRTGASNFSALNGRREHRAPNSKCRSLPFSPTEEPLDRSRAAFSNCFLIRPSNAKPSVAGFVARHGRRIRPQRGRSAVEPRCPPS